MRVFVYFNLHRKCWSIKALEGAEKGRVIGHAEYVDLSTVTWKVSEVGRQRVLRERKKNVHAGAVGKLERWQEPDGTAHGVPYNSTTFDGIAKAKPTLMPDMVTYNPYKGPTFTDKDTGEAVHMSSAVYLCPNRKIYSYKMGE